MATEVKMLNPVTLTAGTFTFLTTSALFASSVAFEADTLNTGNIYLGASGVTSTNGQTIQRAKKFTITFDTVYGSNGKIDLRTIAFATDTSGNAVRTVYLEWKGG